LAVFSRMSVFLIATVIVALAGLMSGALNAAAPTIFGYGLRCAPETATFRLQPRKRNAATRNEAASRDHVTSSVRRGSAGRAGMEQNGLVENIVAVLEGEDRVRAAWLAGSRARGTSDRYSDLDIWAVTAPEDHRSLLADWPELAKQVGPAVLCQQVGPLPVYTHITPGWERYDIAFGTTGDVSRRSRTSVRLLFDRDGLDALLAGPAGPQRPDPAKIQATTTEFLRVLGLLPVVIGREEYVVAASGAGLLRTLLIQLMIEDTEAEDRGGALKLKGLLPPGRLEALASLPPIAATRESAIEAHLACARLFLPLARELSRRTGAPWPAGLETAARSYLHTSLSITF
jgi:hypothetical protein